MHIKQGEQDPQNENRALVIPSSFRVDKEITMFSGQLLQVRNHLSAIIINHHVIRQRFSLNLFWKNGLVLTSKLQKGKSKEFFITREKEVNKCQKNIKWRSV